MSLPPNAARQTGPNPPPEVIEAAAAAWLSLRDRGLSAAETAEFVRWLQEDPQHAAVFEELESVWKDLSRLASVSAGVRGRAAAPEGAALARRGRRRSRRVWVWPAAAAAAAAAAALVLLAALPFRAPAYTAETAVGAFQKLDLPDGSVAQLNTNTAIETEFSGEQRRVRLIRGEAHFSVVPDAARPFIVIAGPVAVRAVGTAFNVHQRDDAVEVLVTQGRVRLDDADPRRSLLAADAAAVEPPLLIAGERAVVATSATDARTPPVPAAVHRLSPGEMQRALAWQERRLEFDAVPLAEVVREFNRYNRQQLAIEGGALRNRRFSGTFRADGYEAFVRLLEEDFDVTVSREGGAIVLRVRP